MPLVLLGWQSNPNLPHHKLTPPYSAMWNLTVWHSTVLYIVYQSESTCINKRQLVSNTGSLALQGQKLTDNFFILANQI